MSGTLKQCPFCGNRRADALSPVQQEPVARAPVTDEELEQWAQRRADDAGRLARELIAYRRAAAPTAPVQQGWRAIEDGAPTGWHNYFFIRPTGLHPASGKPFLPTVVQQVGGQFYESDNELDPVYFGQHEPEDSPFRQTLEWMPIPAGWFDPSDKEGG